MGDPLFDKNVDERFPGKHCVSADMESLLGPELRREERLLWVGQPRPDLFARQAWGAVVFGFVWTAFSSIFLIFAASHLLAGGFRSVFDANVFLPPIFVGIGLAILSSPYWMRRKAKRTCYALTDRRAILWEPGWFKSMEVRSYGPEALAGVFRVEYPGGGDVVLVEEFVVRPGGDGNHIEVAKRGFLGIENAREVEELLRRSLLESDY